MSEPSMPQPVTEAKVDVVDKLGLGVEHWTIGYWLLTGGTTCLCATNATVNHIGGADDRMSRQSMIMGL